jgi:formylglycine-generating enzyme required for sulfatase activity
LSRGLGSCTGLAFTAPHWPLHAPDECIKQYEGKDDAGCDATRDRRVARMKELGLIPRGSGAYEDAAAYARWLGRDSPAQAQWEYAARGGLHARSRPRS